MKKFIAVAGNIGVGKSTLTAMLAEKLAWEPFYEAVDDNPYLADFYANMQQWSFHSQVFFLSRRLRHHRQILDRPGTVVQDRSVYEDAEVFAENLFRQGNMSERDYRTYRELYTAMRLFLPPPDLVVYLRASVPVLIKRIRKRGRDFERQVSAEYLGQLNQLYEEWIDRFSLCPVLTVPADNLDFVQYNSHMELIAAKIVDKLSGKEVVVFD
ncbi:MAG: Deoxyadenosine/deoxycytidine kinase [Chloroflexi bacterium ADurb.Bin180]|nr:MAG: Deoxyadenosine/deoxycytidine kinase [Chloroflexi bacterium ADurb.Bin180]HNR95512.1 deoxynucleoside kinase [Anaerolineae bacterium]HNT05428.1 deoxynucleoside kinase [Anaerolineae bacterium]HOU23746.1 deoxynucleoside kinase [Anaerolineae bacterium]HQJ50327.1 deoxynucleoside kinase [Anaerolineae bacterium]